jgi:hypothetical protein
MHVLCVTGPAADCTSAVLSYRFQQAAVLTGHQDHCDCVSQLKPIIGLYMHS